MTTNENVTKLRARIESILSQYGIENVRSDQPLFSSGMLDSIAAVQVLLQLENDFQVDLSDEDFDITYIDTLQSLEQFLADRQK